MSVDFLPDWSRRAWTPSDASLDCHLVVGSGRERTVVVVVETERQPADATLRELRTEREWCEQDEYPDDADAVVVAWRYRDGVALCGPLGDAVGTRFGLSPTAAEHVCEVALKREPREIGPFLRRALVRLGDGRRTVGVRTRDLLSTAALGELPTREGWTDATSEGRAALNSVRDSESGVAEDALFRELGYESEPITETGTSEPSGTSVSADTSLVDDDGSGRLDRLRSHEDGTPLALRLRQRAPDDELDEQERARRLDRTARRAILGRALEATAAAGLGRLVVVTDRELRLHVVDPTPNPGPAGRLDAFVAVDVDALAADDAGYLWSFFAAESLREGGRIDELLTRSTELDGRLSAQLHGNVVAALPRMERALIEAGALGASGTPGTSPASGASTTTDGPGAEGNDVDGRTLALVVLYRLAFVAHAERAGYLPLRRDERYRARSLTRLARRAVETKTTATDEAFHDAAVDELFDDTATTYWDGFVRALRALGRGRAEWGLPEYGRAPLSIEGRLSSSRTTESSPTTPAGTQSNSGSLALLSISDSTFGPILAALFDDDGDVLGLDDIGPSRLGTVYERVLDGGETDGHRERAGTNESERIEGDRRKSSGSYYTDRRFVDHLLDHSLDPALDAHLARLDGMSDDEAAANLLDIDVADVAMGSGNVLVAAVDRMERRLGAYAVERGLPRPWEGDRSVGSGIGGNDTGSVVDGGGATGDRRGPLWRAVARRCAYGVDVDPIAVELARLSLWSRAFEPGLAFSAFDYGLVVGDSLTGIGTMDEVADRFDEEARGAIRTSIERAARVAGDRERGDPRAIRRAVDTRSKRAREEFDRLTAERVADAFDTDGDEHEQVGGPGGLPGVDISPIHFPTAFPSVFASDGGFDAVVGNPPWEEATLEADEFWLRYAPDRRGTSPDERERLEASLRESRPALVAQYERERRRQKLRRQALAAGPYPGMGTGDPDLYKAFAWRFRALAAPEGHVGVVLPRSALVAAGSETFRRALLDESDVHDLTLLKNRDGWVFDGVSEQYTVALVGYGKGESAATVPFRGPYPDASSYATGLERGPYRFPVEQARSWTRTAAFPLLPSDPAAIGVFRRLAEHPPLGRDEPSEWRARPHTELHATNDKRTDDGTRLMWFGEGDENRRSGYWPIYKGASFTHWTPDTGVRYAWGDPDDVLAHLQQRRENSYRYAGTRSAYAEFDDEWIQDPETLPCRSTRIAFRDVARSTDSRTMIPALVPPDTFLTNKAPYFLWPRGDERDEAYLLGVLASIPLDWYARRFVELNLNYHLVNALPVPRPGRSSALRRRVETIAARLVAVDDRYADWVAGVDETVEDETVDDEVRVRLTAELDAVVAHLYGLADEELRVIYRTFDEGDARRHADRASRALEAYDGWGERVIE